jgi:hypothetical protein
MVALRLDIDSLPLHDEVRFYFGEFLTLQLEAC